MKLFGAGKTDHPMSDLKDARKILDAIPAGDPFKALEDLSHWLDSVQTWEGFKADHRFQLMEFVDDAQQPHLRRLQRDYLAAQRLSGHQENRLWTAIRESCRQTGKAFETCLDFHASGQKGSEDLKKSLPLLAVRALRAFSAQMKWQYIRYGPLDHPLWGAILKAYSFTEERKVAQAKVSLPGARAETTPTFEFLKPVMLGASSPDALLPIEIDLVERLIAHLVGSFKLSTELQPDIAYCIDLLNIEPPVRVAHLPHRAPTLRYFSAVSALKEIEKLIQTVKSTGTLPPGLASGLSSEKEVALEVLEHLALNWSPKPPERKAPRHKVKSRLAAIYGYESVLAALGLTGASLDKNKVENWVVENVSTGGFGASVPQLKSESLKIGCLLGLQPEGGTNWLVGIVRRFQREGPQNGAVGIQTLSRNPLPVKVRVQSGQVTSRDEETAILLNPSDSALEAQLLLRGGVLTAGQNLLIERNGKAYLLIPTGDMERGDDYELVRCRQLVREAG
jgi:hypothetical protein